MTNVYNGPILNPPKLGTDGLSLVPPWQTTGIDNSLSLGLHTDEEMRRRMEEWRMKNLGVTAPAAPWTTGVDKNIRVAPVPMERHLRYKGIVFSVSLMDEVMEFFEDPKNILPEEMGVLSITHPKDHQKIRDKWVSVYVRVEAAKVFDRLDTPS